MNEKKTEKKKVRKDHTNQRFTREPKNAMHARTSTGYATNAALQTNTVTYKPFTHKHTSMSGYNAYGHEQIGAVTLQTTHGNRRVQGIMLSRAGKKGSGSASLSQPKARAVLAQVSVLPSVNPTHDPVWHHVPRPNRRLALTQALRRGTLYSKLTSTHGHKHTSTQSDSSPLKTWKVYVHLVAKKSPPRPHPSSWELFGEASHNPANWWDASRGRGPPTSNTQWNARTSHLLVPFFSSQRSWGSTSFWAATL